MKINPSSPGSYTAPPVLAAPKTQASYRTVPLAQVEALSANTAVGQAEERERSNIGPILL